MFAKLRVGIYMIDNDCFSALPYLMANGRLQFQLAAGLKPKHYLIPDRTGHPQLVRYASHRGKTHPRRTANDFQQGRNDRNTLYRCYICDNIFRQDFQIKGISKYNLIFILPLISPFTP